MMQSVEVWSHRPPRRGSTVYEMFPRYSREWWSFRGMRIAREAISRDNPRAYRRAHRILVKMAKSHRYDRSLAAKLMTDAAWMRRLLRGGRWAQSTSAWARGAR